MLRGSVMVIALVVFLPLAALNLSSLHAEPGKLHERVSSHGTSGLVQDMPRLAQGPAVGDASKRRSGIVIGPPARHEEKSIERDLDSDQQIELAFWSSIRDSSDPADFEAYLQTFPNGAFVLLARNRLAALIAGPVETIATQDEVTTPTDPIQLARMLQTALLHAGCSPGKSDGKWGARSRHALQQFNRHAGTTFQLDTPTAEALETVRSRSDVCPVVAEQPRRPTARATRRPTAPVAQRTPAAQPTPAQPRVEPQQRSCIRKIPDASVQLRYWPDSFC